MMLVEGSIRRARTDWPSGGIARRNAHPPPQQRGGDPGVSPMPGPVYQPIHGSGGKPAASPSSPSRFTSTTVKANQAPQAPSATAWRHFRKDSLPTQQAPAIANRLVSPILNCCDARDPPLGASGYAFGQTATEAETMKGGCFQSLVVTRWRQNAHST